MKKAQKVLRPHAEQAFKHELKALRKNDKGDCPAGWLLSPNSVVTYVLGGTLDDGTEITPKYFGQRSTIEVAVATLLTDRALLMTGIPGTAKTWVSEHLVAAICDDSTLLIQGTSGTGEDALRYGWNYAELIAKGPSEKALVPSPVMKAMEEGKMVRIEELTRIPSDVQDALLTVLSEKTLPIPELNMEVQAKRGFNVIATANDRDRGINDMSSALRRRFNTVIMPLPATLQEEVKIVKTRIDQLNEDYALRPESAPIHEIQRLVTIFRELRSGVTMDGLQKIKAPTATLSTAEAISAINSSQAMAQYFGGGIISAKEIAQSLVSAVIKDSNTDRVVWETYRETILKEKSGWEDLYEACKTL